MCIRASLPRAQLVELAHGVAIGAVVPKHAGGEGPAGGWCGPWGCGQAGRVVELAGRAEAAVGVEAADGLSDDEGQGGFALLVWRHCRTNNPYLR